LGDYKEIECKNSGGFREYYPQASASTLTEAEPTEVSGIDEGRRQAIGGKCLRILDYFGLID
jgi:hypothetical protein